MQEIIRKSTLAGPSNQLMNLTRYGNVLIDLSDIIFATREGDETVLKLRGGHQLIIGGEVGNAIWNRLSRPLIDQMPKE